MSKGAKISRARTAEVPLGLWPQVQARVRPALLGQMPEGVRIGDQRMVEFWKTGKGGWKGTGVAMLSLVGLYSPLREPNLLSEFIHLFGSELPAPDRKVIEFYGRYGPLRESAVAEQGLVPAWTERLGSRARRRVQAESTTGYCEPLWWLREKALELRLTYDLYVALKKDHPDSLRAKLGAVPEGKAVADVHIVAGQIVRDLVAVDTTGDGSRKVGSFSLEQQSAAASSRLKLRPLMDDEARYWARVLLTKQLNAAESSSSRRWCAREAILAGAYSRADERARPAGAAVPDLVRVRTFQGLTAALYLQIGDLVERDALLRCCQGCARLFRPMRRDQVYCDARCGDAARHRTTYAPRQRDEQPSVSVKASKAGKRKRTAK